MEQDSWRDQPWWAYTISQYAADTQKPYIIPTRADTMVRRGKKGLNGHHYNETSEGTAQRVHYYHPPIDSCGRLTMQSRSGALPYDWPNDADNGNYVNRLLLSGNNVDVAKPLDRHWTKLLTQMSSLKQSKRILDVGTDPAFYASIFASTSPLGSIVLDIFEPNRNHVLRLCEAVLMNQWTSGTERRQVGIPHVYVNPYGLSDNDDDDGTTTTTVVYKDTWGGGTTNSSSSSSTTVLATITTLDHMVHERGWLNTDDAITPSIHSRIYILKMDAQHVNNKALLGAKQLIANYLAQYFVLQVNHGDDDDDTLELSLSLLFKAGYQLEGQGWNTDGPADPSPWPHDATIVENIVAAVRKRKQDDLYLLWGLS